MIFFENEAAALHIIPEQKLAATFWKGFASSDVLRELLQKALEMLDRYTIYYWLSDNRNMKVVRPADQEFIFSEWLQEFISKSKVQKSATIESEDIFAKISVENIRRVADPLIPFETAYFKDLDEAVEWLGVHITEEELHGLHKN